MNENNMRSIVVFGNSTFNAIEALGNLPNWQLHSNKSEGHPYFLQNGETKIYLETIAANVINTVNILPQDHMENHPLFINDALQSLAKDLEIKSILFSLGLSENDEIILSTPT